MGWSEAPGAAAVRRRFEIFPTGIRLKAAAAAILVVAVVSSSACTSMRAPRDGSAIRAVNDPKVIARGRYIVFGPGHCTACHADPARQEDARQGLEVPLSGGRVFDLGLAGSIVAPNITNDISTGLGAISDDTLVRTLRYGTSRHGRPLAPFMSFSDMTAEDLQAVISFLRTLPPVATPVPHIGLNWLGTIGFETIVRPQGPSVAPQDQIPANRTAEYGRYLAYTVANCHGCHTERSKLTGAYIGPAFAGGMVLREGGVKFVTPNLTPTETGVLANLSEEEFIRLFREPMRRSSASPMPWGSFSRMSDSDLGAIYRYLKRLPPARTPSRATSA